MKKATKSPKVINVLNIPAVQRSLERLADLLILLGIPRSSEWRFTLCQDIKQLKKLFRSLAMTTPDRPFGRSKTILDHSSRR
ncbi:hypothetical protein KR084_001710 [Drosophila pseudotakahashii]|nr:hypothetical protein KR084_001710 [Drosophila pseudotakahashii]